MVSDFWVWPCFNRNGNETKSRILIKQKNDILKKGYLSYINPKRHDGGDTNKN